MFPIAWQISVKVKAIFDVVATWGGGISNSQTHLVIMVLCVENMFYLVISRQVCPR